MLNRGEIVLVSFPFTDLTGSKVRPALIFHIYRDDVIVVFISSSLKTIGDCDMVIKRSEENGLKVDSILKLNKIITLDKSLILGKIGDLEKDVLRKANRNFLKMFELEE